MYNKKIVLNNGYETPIASIESKPSVHQKPVDYIEETADVKEKLCIIWDTKQKLKVQLGV